MLLGTILTGDICSSIYPDKHRFFGLSGLRLRPDVHRQTVFTCWVDLASESGRCTGRNTEILGRCAAGVVTWRGCWRLDTGRALRDDVVLARRKCVGHQIPYPMFSHTKTVALTGSFPTNRTGGWKRSFPSGGTAYGIPRYSETPGALAAAWPTTRPLVVRTGCPTVQPAWAGVRTEPAAAMCRTRVSVGWIFMVPNQEHLQWIKYGLSLWRTMFLFITIGSA